MNALPASEIAIGKATGTVLMKIHHSPIPLVDRIAHVLRNDRERTAKFITETLGLNKVGMTRCMSESGRFE